MTAQFSMGFLVGALVGIVGGVSAYVAGRAHAQRREWRRIRADFNRRLAADYRAHYERWAAHQPCVTCGGQGTVGDGGYVACPACSEGGGQP